mmetsp:Transcript_24639/g.53146  ORF Transcript_24639/g.53146 Transcript_24639/m.53146 type:complete len:105 (+) Transcript_24639:595-909(+)
MMTARTSRCGMSSRAALAIAWNIGMSIAFILSARANVTVTTPLVLFVTLTRFIDCADAPPTLAAPKSVCVGDEAVLNTRRRAAKDKPTRRCRRTLVAVINIIYL